MTSGLLTILVILTMIASFSSIQVNLHLMGMLVPSMLTITMENFLKTIKMGAKPRQKKRSLHQELLPMMFLSALALILAVMSTMDPTKRSLISTILISLLRGDMQFSTLIRGVTRLCLQYLLNLMLQI